MTLPMTRSEIFKLSWELARKVRDRFSTTREAFSYALRMIWENVKAFVQVKAEQAARPVVAVPVRSEWATSSAYLAHAAARHRARLGSFVGRAGW